MAERESPPRPPGTPGTPPPAQPGASSAGAPRPPEQEPHRELRQTAQELSAQGTDLAAQVATQGRETVRAWQQQLEHQVLEHPLQSLVIAAGIGLLVGLLQRR